MLLKGKDRRTLHALVRRAQEEMLPHGQSQGVRIIVDVDPYNML